MLFILFEYAWKGSTHMRTFSGSTKTQGVTRHRTYSDWFWLILEDFLFATNRVLLLVKLLCTWDLWVERQGRWSVRRRWQITRFHTFSIFLVLSLQKTSLSFFCFCLFTWFTWFTRRCLRTTNGWNRAWTRSPAVHLQTPQLSRRIKGLWGTTLTENMIEIDWRGHNKYYS